eukprot:5487097-Prymnesium_polylepis.1
MCDCETKHTTLNRQRIKLYQDPTSVSVRKIEHHTSICVCCMLPRSCHAASLEVWVRAVFCAEPEEGLGSMCGA